MAASERARRFRAVVQTRIPALKLSVEGDVLAIRRSWQTVIAARGGRRAESHLHRARRWDGTPGTSKMRRNYNIARPRCRTASTSDKHRQFCELKVSGRRRGSIPAAESVPIGSTPMTSARGRRVLPQHLSSVGEDASHETLEQRLVHQGDRRRAECQPDERRTHSGHRAECARRQGEKLPHLGAQGRQDRQDAILVRADRCDEPFRHLDLQHERRVQNRQPATNRVEHREQDWRRDVVRQIAGDANRALDTSPRIPARECRQRRRSCWGERPAGVVPARSRSTSTAVR